MKPEGPRRKGSSGEREVGKLLGGSQVPLSGSARGPFSGDALVPNLGRGEVRADRREWLVVLRLKTLKRLLDGPSAP